MSKKQFIINGTLLWPKVRKQDDNGNYTVDIIPSDPKVLTKLSEKGVPIKEKIVDGKNVTTVQAKSKFKPITVDAKRKVIPDTILIGNGSKGNVAVTLFKYDPKQPGQTGVGLGLSALQVTDLVEFGGVSTFEDTDGFTVTDEDMNALNEEGTNAVHSFDNDDDEMPF
jgi:hypothetical protein